MIVALEHGEELQVFNFGIVNLTASADYQKMLNLKKYHEIYGHLDSQTSTYERTIIDIHRGKEKIPAAAIKRGLAINTCPTGRTCYVGISSPEEFELCRRTIFKVAEDIALRHCVMTGFEDDAHVAREEGSAQKRRRVS